MERGKNVLGGVLAECSTRPLTGWYRNGCCDPGPGEDGLHLVCARMTPEFLRFATERGNDLSTPIPQDAFPGLQPGDRWCLSAMRWKEALDAGCAPPVILEATHISTLEFVSLDDLQAHTAT